MIINYMVFPAVLGVASVLAGHAARIGITQTTARSFGGQFVQSLPFGAGYSLGTYLGFPKNYQPKTNFKSGTTSVTLMPYGYYPRRRYYRRSYGRRYGRRSYGRYRRYSRRYYRRY